MYFICHIILKDLLDKKIFNEIYSDNLLRYIFGYIIKKKRKKIQHWLWCWRLLKANIYIGYTYRYYRGLGVCACVFVCIRTQEVNPSGSY